MIRERYHVIRGYHVTREWYHVIRGYHVTRKRYHVIRERYHVIRECPRARKLAETKVIAGQLIFLRTVHHTKGVTHVHVQFHREHVQQMKRNA